MAAAVKYGQAELSLKTETERLIPPATEAAHRSFETSQRQCGLWPMQFRTLSNETVRMKIDRT